MIMMVDDEPITMEVVQAFLEDAGYRRFTLVEESRLAIEQIHNTRPDILLLDLVMPEVSGFDILREVRQSPQLRHLPVIILTSSSEPETKLKALDDGATDFLAKPVDPSELALRVRNTLAAKAYQDQLAYYDPVTNLPNRELFLDRLEFSLRQAERHKHNLALMHINLDRFKNVYDTFGPGVSDQVIRQAARRIRGCIREIDLLGQGVNGGRREHPLFRLGRNEFTIICGQMEKAENAATVACRILAVLDEPFDAEGTNVSLKAYIGIASYPIDSADSAALSRCAVNASAQALTEGGKRFGFYSDALNTRSLQRLQLESELRRAIDNDELILHYQPKVEVASNRITGVEALLRWQHPSGGMVPPGKFIGLAEETGLIVPIGDWVLKEACRQIAEWQRRGIQLHVAVNLSAVQFHKSDLVATVSRVIGESKIDPKFLTLELTESLFMEDADLAIETMGRLMLLGPKIAMDDFGTGYSSLSYLKRFPLNQLKIDRSFISDLEHSQQSRALVFAIVYLAQQFDLEVVAEGIEEPSQLEFLNQIGCDTYQGFLFSKPIPAAELEALLE
ncbi:MAG: EAL domain-containing protein [Gammaproteobacteria bacterium]|nr:EAL domain-containing protein [Gammaproteobacteria bacterium]